MTTVLHHCCEVGREQYDVPWHWKMVTAREAEAHETHSAPRRQTQPGDAPGQPRGARAAEE